MVMQKRTALDGWEEEKKIAKATTTIKSRTYKRQKSQQSNRDVLKPVEFYAASQKERQSRMSNLGTLRESQQTAAWLLKSRAGHECSSLHPTCNVHSFSNFLGYFSNSMSKLSLKPVFLVRSQKLHSKMILLRNHQYIRFKHLILKISFENF